MARLIPAYIDEQTPPGERDVFNMLAGGPDDWVAIHSLDLAPWNRSRRTEIDFVIIIPDTGILCVEVKSHQRIFYDGGRWSPDSIKRSPFKQATDGRYTFRNQLRIIARHFANVPVAHCCIFPNARFDLHANLSVSPYELMDTRSFRAFDTSDAFCGDLRLRLVSNIDNDNDLQPLDKMLSPVEVKEIVSACVPVQKRRPGYREEIQRREKEVAGILREQQKPILQLAGLNKRTRVSGGAGTGKTLIAMEVARLAAEKGQRVALLCFNQMVGDWLQEKMKGTGTVPPNLVIGRAIQVMMNMTGVTVPQSIPSSFWVTDLPQLLEERLTDPDFEATATFDYLVLDEAQDLFARPRLWNCLGQFLRGGMDCGSYLLLGDFDHQVLAEHETMRSTLEAFDASSQPVRWHLSENCRNYRIIGDAAISLSGIEASVYSDYRRVGGGSQNYDIKFYENADEQQTQLMAWLREFKELGYKTSEITILSFRDDESSAAMRLKKSGYSLRPARQAGKGTPYTTVHAFKGMESQVILLTDVAVSGRQFERDLFYTGMTRATEHVRVLCEQSSAITLRNWLTGKVAT